VRILLFFAANNQFDPAKFGLPFYWSFNMKKIDRASLAKIGLAGGCAKQASSSTNNVFYR